MDFAVANSSIEIKLDLFFIRRPLIHKVVGEQV